jgi:hypothetical protein
MTRSRILSTLMAAVFLTASISCSPDSLTGVPAQDAPAPAATQASAQPITASPSLLGGLLGTLGGTIDAVNGTVSNTIGDVPIVTPLLSSVSGLLVTCKPQQYASTTKWVGPRGGTLYVGPHKFVIPRGALKTYVKITAEAPADTVVSVRFQPEGLKFDKDHPARLTLDYNACEVSKQHLPSQIAYTDDSLKVIEILSGTAVDKRHRTVTADVKHFSRYALAY